MSKMGTLSSQEYFYKLDKMMQSSYQLLRKVFQSRWKAKSGKDWEPTKEQGKLFLESQFGKKVEKKCKSHQKEIIEKECVDEWDMSILSMVLQHFGDESFYKLENEAVKQLAKLRNDLAHHPTKKLSREQYNTKTQLFRKNLLELNVTPAEIENIIVKAGLTLSEDAREATKKLLEKGETLMKSEEFKIAVQFYDEATTMHSLLPVQEGAVYEARAECYLKWANFLKRNQKRNEADKCVEQAMLDATCALQLNDGSWNAHFLIAKCHHWKTSTEKAVQHYIMALAICPAQLNVKMQLDSCKELAVSLAYIDIDNVPISFNERLERFEKTTGTKLTEEQFIRMMRMDIFSKGQGDSFRGRQYWNGWAVPQSDVEAARCFAKAARVGNAEGIHCLGFCYTKGRGVQQDLQKAYKLYLQAANMSPETFGGLKDSSVARAQLALGLFFHHGIFVEQNSVEAAKCFAKSVENGDGVAAHNLGVLYFKGEGVPRNEKKAEMLWNQAVKLKVPNAALSLISHYIVHLEPEKARTMFQTGKELGNNDISEDQFNKRVDASFDLQLEIYDKTDRKELEADVIAFERKYKLDCKGMTFLERLLRQPNPFIVSKNGQGMRNNDTWEGQIKSNDGQLHIIERMGNEGSVAAQRVMEAIHNGLELDDFLTENECESDTEKIRALELLYKCCTGEFHVASVGMYTPTNKNKLKRLVGQLFNSKCWEMGEEEMKTRFCYVFFNSLGAEKSQLDLMMVILKQGIKMYPDNVHYYNFLSYLCELNNDHQSGLEWCETALQKFPTDVELLYSKAVHLRHLYELEQLEKVQTSGKMVAAYMAFLAQAPPEHRRVSSVYYAMAYAHMDCGLKEHYFNLGKKAEGKMLPLYLYAAEPHIKRAAETVLMMERAKLSSGPESPSHFASNRILERKQYLSSAIRKQLILNHRHHQSSLDFCTERLEIYVSNPKLMQTAPTRLSRLKGITLSEMNPTSDHIFEDRIIDLTVIEEPYLGDGLPSIHLVVEDENGDVTRLYIFNVEQNKEAAVNWAHGSTIAIMNPYMRIGALDGKTCIRNDEPSCILYLGRVEKMCRFCGEENAEKKCSRCKKACYCSRECQELDWKLFKHKLICSV